LSLPTVSQRAMTGADDARYELRPHGKEGWTRAQPL
jgi:hypothetical protein